MKRNYLMGLTLLFGMTLAPSASASAQCCQEGVYTQDYSNQPKLVKAAQKWYKKGKWRNGFKKADAHSSVNLVDFYLQYQKNPEQWKALFDFLAKTDLFTISKDKHPIPGSDRPRSKCRR